MGKPKEKINGMSVIDSHIENGSFSNVYLLEGPEKYLLHQFKDKLIGALCDKDDSMNFGIFKNDNAKADIIGEFASTMPFFADRRVALVENSGFFDKGNPQMVDILLEIPDTTVIIFVEDEVRRNTQIFKKVNEFGTVATFEAPDLAVLQRWIGGLFAKDRLKVEMAAVNRLIDCVGTDMTTLSNEIEKLRCYCLEKGQVTVADVELQCMDKVQDKIFYMIDAIVAKDKKKSMELYSDLLILRAPAMKTLSLITRQYVNLLKTKCALDGGATANDIMAMLGVMPFVANKCISQCKHFTKEQLLECTNLCQNTDNDIKTGRMRDEAAVDLLIMNLLRD